MLSTLAPCPLPCLSPTPGPGISRGWGWGGRRVTLQRSLKSGIKSCFYPRPCCAALGKFSPSLGRDSSIYRAGPSPTLLHSHPLTDHVKQNWLLLTSEPQTFQLAEGLGPLPFP